MDHSTEFALAKISRPRGNRPVPRQRLFERLDALREATVIWVAAPPGAGKTTLVSSYLADRGLASVWYQLDAEDADAATFFHYLGLAVHQAAVRAARPLPALLPEYLPGLLGFARRFAQAIAEAVAHPAVIVLDNGEQVPPDAPLHEVLRELASALPAGLSLVVLSRREPPPAYARLRLHEDLRVLAGAELALTRDEAVALAHTRQGDAPVAADAARIEQLLLDTQGWLAGFVLLLAEPGGTQPPAGNIGTQQLLFDYFATELFTRFPPATQTALLRTALLPTMTVADAESLCGDAAVGRVLRELHQQNCFVVQRGQNETVYEYHALFRAFLLDRAAGQIGADDWRNLQCRAADLLGAAKQPDAAAALYRAAGEWPGLAALILREAAALMSAGRHRTLEHWLHELPPGVFAQSPWLFYWQAAARLPFDPVESRGWFEQAYAGFQRQDDPAGLYSAWAGVMESFFYEWRDFAPADRWIAEFELLRARHPQFPSRAVELRTYWAMGTWLHRQPQHPMLPAWSERALSLLGPAERELSVLLGGYLLIWLLWRGETAKAHDVIEQLMPWTESDVSPMVLILWSCAVGLYHSVQGKTEACQQAIERGLEVARRTGLQAFDFLLCAQMARGSLVAGAPDEADAWMARMARSMRSRSHIDGAFYHRLRFNAAAQRGQWLQALEQAQAAITLSLAAGVPFLQASCRIDLARAVIGLADGSDWHPHIEAARVIARAMHSRVLEYLCLEVEAEAAFGLGDETTGLAHLADAMALSRAMDGGTWRLTGPHTLAPLCDRALAADIEVEHVQRLIRRHRLSPPDPATAADTWPWPVRVHTLGRFEILCDGRLQRSSGKAQHKPLELLQCLCAFGGQAVSQDRVIDALWPDTEGDAGDQALRTTLHRLRKLLGHDHAVHLSDRHLALEPGIVWVDCLAFDRVAHQALAQDTAGLRRCLDHYRGHFLDGEAAPWALTFREELRAQFARLAQRLADRLGAEGDWAGAIDCDLRALEIEPLAEGFYRHLMLAHGQLGQRAEALAVYQRCQEVLRARLGMAPGAATQALARQLMVR